MVHSHCDFFGQVAFPAVLDLGLRAKKLGKSSVTYEIGLFERSVEAVKAVGCFTHVFVDRESYTVAEEGMPREVKHGLERIMEGRALL